MARALPIALLSLLALFPRAYADAPTTPRPKQETIREAIHDTAIKYSINESRFLATLTCESNLDPAAVGDNGTSLGIAQIHMPSHASIRPVDAFNPYWAIEWAGKQFSMGNARIWSCYNLLYK